MNTQVFMWGHRLGHETDSSMASTIQIDHRHTKLHRIYFDSAAIPFNLISLSASI